MADTLTNATSLPSIQSPPKRIRLDATLSHHTTQPIAVTSNSPAASLTTLPLELLAEILLHTHSPPTVLAVSRTSSYFHRTLAHPTVSFIWRGVRKTCEPAPLPEPGSAWRQGEAAYAALVYDGGVCEICKKKTPAMYVSFAARSDCVAVFTVARSFSLYNALVPRSTLWVPYVESTRCFAPMSIIYTDSRKSGLYSFRSSIKTHQEGQLLNSEPIAGDGENSQAAEADEDLARFDRFLERCHTAMERFPEIMDLSVQLLDWKRVYEEKHRLVKAQNESWAKVLAAQEGWDLRDLMNSQAYGALHRRKTYILEEVGWGDVRSIQPAIESEILERQARRNRQKAEEGYAHRLVEVQKIYERMRSGALEGVTEGGTGSSGFGSKVVLPSLPVFCSLPSVRALKGRPDPNLLRPEDNNGVTANLKTSPLAISLITSDIRYSSEWRSASNLKLPPLERINARFLCGRCSDGGVGGHYQRPGCLDFRGVCSHVCKKAKAKGVEGKRQETQEHRDTEGDNVDSQLKQDAVEVKKSSGKKRKKVSTLDWRVDVFRKDEKAIALINVVLDLFNLSDERSLLGTNLNRLGGMIRCTTCTGLILMDFETAIGHSHRHESMQIELLLTSFRLLPFTIPQAAVGAPTPRLLAFDRGLSERLMGLSNRARNLRDKVNYGCKHCLVIGEDNVVRGFQEAGKGGAKHKGAAISGARAMNFHALRSHVKAKHGIQDIRDEDIFCYSPVEWVHHEANTSEGANCPCLD
ncbi:hypothetical protein BU15DRAFT_63827 [Melanogaster broomeanus]|nr:hypothetical protein BU15DRAFT_63827 [Melanogaster broomeanus]